MQLATNAVKNYGTKPHLDTVVVPKTPEPKQVDFFEEHTETVVKAKSIPVPQEDVEDTGDELSEPEIDIQPDAVPEEVEITEPEPEVLKPPVVTPKISTPSRQLPPGAGPKVASLQTSTPSGSNPAYKSVMNSRKPTSAKKGVSLIVLNPGYFPCRDACETSTVASFAPESLPDHEECV